MYNVTFIGGSTIARPQIEHYEQRISISENLYKRKIKQIDTRTSVYEQCMAKATLSQVKLETKDKCTSGKQYGTLQTNGIKVSKRQIDETKAAVAGYSGMTMITMYIR